MCLVFSVAQSERGSVIRREDLHCLVISLDARARERAASILWGERRENCQLSKCSMLKSNADFLKDLEFLDVTTEILPKYEKEGFISRGKKYSFTKSHNIWLSARGNKKHASQSIHFV